MKVIVSSVFFFFCFALSAQQSAIDSLSAVFHSTTQDTVKARILAEIGIASYRTDFALAKSLNDSLISFSRKRSPRFLAQGLRMKGTYAMLEGDYKTALEDYDKAMAIVVRLGRKDIQADYLSNYATLYNYQGKTDSSEIYYLKSIDLKKELGRDLENVTSYINLSNGARRNNEVQLSTEYLIEALALSENSDKQYRLEYIHTELAKNYLTLNQYNKAEYHLDKGLIVAKKNNDIGALANIYSAFGYLIETRDDSPEQAISYYEQALSNYLKGGSEGDIINTYYNVGLQNIKLDNLSIAETQSQEGLQRAETIKDRERIIYGYLQLADVYILQGKNNQAQKLLNQANDELLNRSSINSRQQFLRIGKSFESIGYFKESAKYIEKYAVLSDSLYQKNSIEKITEVEERYETEKKENEILRLENKNVSQQLTNQQQRYTLYLMSVGAILLMLGLAVSFFYYRKSKKQKERIEDLQRELHHRVKNNLAIIDSYISLAKKGVEDENVIKKLYELHNRVNSINAIHEQLHVSNDVSELNIKEYIDRLSTSIQNSFDNRKIDTKIAVDPKLTIDASKAFSLGLIINEFLINSFKHAFKEITHGIVNINFKENKTAYTLELSDNGVGLPDNLNIDDLDSFGIDIMKISSEQLKGNFNLINNGGVILTITFPK